MTQFNVIFICLCDHLFITIIPTELPLGKSIDVIGCSTYLNPEWWVNNYQKHCVYCFVTASPREVLGVRVESALTLPDIPLY